MAYTVQQIFAFYLAIIVVAAVVTFSYSTPETQMMYSMYAAIGGAVVSIFLWNYYGAAMVGQSSVL